MDMFDEAFAIKGMIELKKMTQSEVAKLLGVSQSYIANKLRLLHFSPGIRREIIKSELTESHARALLRLKDDEAISEAISKITKMRLSVAASEALVDGMALSKAARSVATPCEGECISTVEKLISEAVGYLRSNGISARKSIEFYGTKRYITLTIDENKI